MPPLSSGCSLAQPRFLHFLTIMVYPDGGFWGLLFRSLYIRPNRLYRRTFLKCWGTSAVDLGHKPTMGGTLITQSTGSVGWNGA